ncbi:MAG: DUF6171 family protein [Lachnospiraceae bacterium]|nr:DUF6171 family protein [Lachnospiraceae bacterium]
MEEAENRSLCKRCLLREAGDSAAYTTVKEYMEKLPDSLRVEKSIYEKRLSICKECENLLSGTCLKCGCYVEIRAAAKTGGCPLKKAKW